MSEVSKGFNGSNRKKGDQEVTLTKYIKLWYYWLVSKHETYIGIIRRGYQEGNKR